MTELTEDKRQAAAIIPVISSNIGTASLAAFAGLIALYTYLAQTYKLEGLFYAAAVLAAICLASSLVLGGLGTKKLVEKVGAGTWQVCDKIVPYRIQTVAAIVGLGLIGVATIVAVNAPHLTDRTAQSIRRLDERVAALERQQKAQGACISRELGRADDPMRRPPALGSLKARPESRARLLRVMHCSDARSP